MRSAVVVIWMLLGACASTAAQVSSTGINLPIYPDLVPVPRYPVYYAPQLDSNFLFYDGLYWVYAEDSWYASSWYNGPWETVALVPGQRACRTTCVQSLEYGDVWPV